MSDSWPALFHYVGENTWEELIPSLASLLCGSEPSDAGGYFPAGGDELMLQEPFC